MLIRTPVNGHSKSESSIRHQVRKLRAKVHTLLPCQGCEAHEKRNTKVFKIQHKRRSECVTPETKGGWGSRPGTSAWKLGAPRVEQWYTESAQSSGNQHNQVYHFERLLPEEIERINEDKLYYLGERNIEAYNRFLKSAKKGGSEKPKMVMANESALHMNTNGQQNQKFAEWQRMRTERRGKTAVLHRQHSSDFQIYSSPVINLDQMRAQTRESTTSVKKQDYNSAGPYTSVQPIGQSNLFKKVRPEDGQNNKTAEERRRQIDQRLRRRQLEQKVKLDYQMSKAEANQREMKYRQFSRIKDFQETTYQRQQKALQRRGVLMRKGEIVQIQEQLRDLVLKKKSSRGHQRTSSCIHQTTSETEILL